MAKDERIDELPNWELRTSSWLARAETEAITERQFNYLVEMGLKPGLLVYMSKAEAYRRIKRIIETEQAKKG